MQENLMVSALRTLVTLTTIATLILIVRHYMLSLQFLKAREIARPTGKFRIKS